MKAEPNKLLCWVWQAKVVPLGCSCGSGLSRRSRKRPCSLGSSRMRGFLWALGLKGNTFVFLRRILGCLILDEAVRSRCGGVVRRDRASRTRCGDLWYLRNAAIGKPLAFNANLVPQKKQTVALTHAIHILANILSLPRTVLSRAVDHAVLEVAREHVAIFENVLAGAVLLVGHPLTIVAGAAGICGLAAPMARPEAVLAFVPRSILMAVRAKAMNAALKEIALVDVPVLQLDTTLPVTEVVQPAARVLGATRISASAGTVALALLERALVDIALGGAQHPHALSPSQWEIVARVNVAVGKHKTGDLLGSLRPPLGLELIVFVLAGRGGLESGGLASDGSGAGADAGLGQAHHASSAAHRE
eukprot:m.240381 g.240381  ORF g.240381 m.240381 type:complete len:361 (-) comp54402_c0_seq2:3-1085(-)